MKKSFQSAIILVAVTVSFFMTCSDLQPTKFDKNYNGDYKLDLNFSRPAYYPFQSYKLPIKQGGDLYKELYVSTKPQFFLDTNSFLYKPGSDSLEFYFIKPSSGTVVITALRDNDDIDTFSYNVTVKSPFVISGDSAAMTGDTLSFKLNQTSDAISGDNVKNVLWFIDTMKADSENFKSSANISFPRKGKFIVKAVCVDWKNNIMTADSMAVNVYTNYYRILSITPQKSECLINDSADVNIKLTGAKADTGSLFVVFGKDTIHKSITFSADTVTDSIRRFTGKNKGTIEITAWFLNKYGKTTPSLKASLEIIDSTGLPTLTGVRISPDTIYKNHKVSITILSIPSSTDAPVTEYNWEFDGVSAKDTVSKIPSKSFVVKDDTLICSVSVKDSKDAVSKPYSVRIPVNPGIPEIISVKKDDTACWKIPAVFNIKARDPDSLLKNVIINWADSMIDTIKLNTKDTTVQVSHKYMLMPSAGNYNISLTAIDVFGMKSAIYSVPMPVKSGVPSIDSISIPSGDKYVCKAFSINVYGHDNNSGGNLDLFKVTLSNDSTTLNFTSKSSIVPVKLNSTQYGVYKISARVCDNDTNWSPAKNADKPVTVLPSNPKIDTVIKADIVYWKVPAIFNIKAEDPDSLLKNVIINWEDGTIDTITVNSKDTILQASHKFMKLPPSGYYNISVTAKDINDLNSAVIEKKIFIDPGKPGVEIQGCKFKIDDKYIGAVNGYNDSLITILSGDTLICPRSQVSRMLVSFIRLNAKGSDVNGKVLSYGVAITPALDTTGIRWQDSSQFSLDTSTIIYSDAPYSAPTKAIIYCKDEDGFIGADTFWIKTILPFENLYNQQIISSPGYGDTIYNDSIEILWTGGQDLNEGSQTNVSISIYYNFKDDIQKYNDSVFVKGVARDYVYNGNMSRCVIKLPWSDVSSGTQTADIIISIWDRLRQMYRAKQTIYITK
jgi:hypothetical protein